MDAFLRERTQQVPAAGDVDDGIAGTISSSEEGAVGAVGTLTVPAGKADSDPSAASTPRTGQGYGEDPPAVLWGGQRTSSAITGDDFPRR